MHLRVRGGTYSRRWSSRETTGASPRARRNHTGRDRPVPVTGTSPRARRNRHLADVVMAAVGCISACAEEPGRPVVETDLPGVHLRVRGGTTPASVSARSHTGASPRARRNRQVGGGRRSSRRVHLRVRGATVQTDGSNSAATGASPRARRNRSVANGKAWDQGCISACAEEPLECRTFLAPTRRD